MIKNNIFCVNELTPFLGLMYQVVFTHKHYPVKWKRYTTAVLQKGGRADYTIPGLYRPITLLDTIMKVMASVIKDKIQYHTERLQLLFQMQFSGQPVCTTTDTLMSYIKDDGNESKVL